MELTAQFVVAGIGAFAASLSLGVRALLVIVSSAVVSKAQGGLRKRDLEAKQLTKAVTPCP